MNISNTILTENVGAPDILPDLRGVKEASDDEKRRLAMEFESLLVNKLIDEMGNSIGSLGLGDEQANEQIKGIFNMYLSRHIGNSGGLGLWKDIYESFARMSQRQAHKPQELDKQI